MTGKIETEEAYEAALKHADEIFDSQPGTPEGDELDRLTDEIVAYEEEHFQFGAMPPDKA